MGSVPTDAAGGARLAGSSVARPLMRLASHEVKQSGDRVDIAYAWRFHARIGDLEVDPGAREKAYARARHHLITIARRLAEVSEPMTDSYMDDPLKRRLLTDIKDT